MTDTVQLSLFQPDVRISVSKETFSQDCEIKALSWKQPYADLMLHGKIETRTWPTTYRGWVLICSSQSAYSNYQVWYISGQTQSERIKSIVVNKGPKVTGLNGFAIAIGYLAECRPMRPEDSDKCFVEYNPKLWCHIYKNVRRIKPFKWKGQLGFKALTPGQKSIIETC